MTLGLLSRWRTAFERAPDCVPETTSSKNSSHIPALDAIRGLAILMVTAYRFNQGTSLHDGDSVISVLNSGFRGVDLFFVLSGFLITGILYDTKGTSHYFRNFYMRRTLRIFPLYYGVLIVTFLILPFVSPWTHSLYGDAANRQIWLWTYGTNIYQAWTGQWAFGRFNHFWSLAVEEHFYLLWPLVIFCLSRVAAMRACVFIILASFSARVIWLVCGGSDTAAEVLTVFRVDSLVAGAWLSLVTRGPSGLKGLVPIAWIGLVASGLALAAVAAFQRRFLTATDPLFLCLFGSLILIATSLRRGEVLGWIFHSRFLRFFGKYSYGIYVFQNLLIPVFAPAFTFEGLAEGLHSAAGGRIAYIVLMSVITTAFAVLSYHAYEKHFLQLKTFFADRG